MGAVALTAIVAVVYRDATRIYYFNDDFQWLQQARTFTPVKLLHIERYNHFYRPVIEIYFFIGRRLFGCDPVSFHVASVVVHVLNAALLYAFARALTRSAVFAGVAALLFAVHPGYVQAVVWVAAITDLLPATWYFLALWTYLLFLERRGSLFYAISLAAFVTCLLTHESSATLLPMMIALEALTMVDREGRFRLTPLATLTKRYAPFAVCLAVYLAIEYVVNSRSYLITEGHYQLGWHAIPHALDYLITLSTGMPDFVFRALAVAAVAALLVLGTARVRFFVVWMLVTIAPSAFFTWGNSSRYLYLPAAGFAMLLAEGLLALQRLLASRLLPQNAWIATGLLTLALVTQFAVSTSKLPKEFREVTQPYRRFVAAVRRSNPAPADSSIVYVDRENAHGIPALYLDPAAEVATCGPDVHVVLR
jgi:protein O-mannosyl-transferase